MIQSEAEYEKTLSRLNDIFDARAGTPEGDELECLVLLLEQYEKVKYPMDDGKNPK